MYDILYRNLAANMRTMQYVYTCMQFKSQDTWQDYAIAVYSTKDFWKTLFKAILNFAATRLFIIDSKATSVIRNRNLRLVVYFIYLNPPFLSSFDAVRRSPPRSGFRIITVHAKKVWVKRFFFPYSRFCSGLYGSGFGKVMTSGETTADGGVHVVFNDEDLVFEEEILRNPYR